MKAWRLKNQEKGGIQLPEDKIMIIAIITIAVIIIAVISVFIFIQPMAGKATTQPADIKKITPTENGLSSAQTTNDPKTIRPSGTPATQPTAAVPVNFVLQPGVPTNCGLTCRQLDATLTNSGYMTAHNVCIAVSMHNSRNEIIGLNGDPALNRCVGDIAGGKTITESISINADCGVFATKCIGETLTLQTQVVSDETTVRFPDQVISV